MKRAPFSGLAVPSTPVEATRPERPVPGGQMRKVEPSHSVEDSHHGKISFD